MSNFPVIRGILKNDPELQAMMAAHYSRPKGFVGRQLFYSVEYKGELYGCVGYGSATKHLPGRSFTYPLNYGLNNIFCHFERVNGKYPFRNFVVRALLSTEKFAIRDYRSWYGDPVLWFETLVELPRTGELYTRAGYRLVGQTKGYTCKRMGELKVGRGSDSWSGKRVWDTENLRPKHVFIKETARVQ